MKKLLTVALLLLAVPLARTAEPKPYTRNVAIRWLRTTVYRLPQYPNRRSTCSDTSRGSLK